MHGFSLNEEPAVCQALDEGKARIPLIELRVWWWTEDETASMLGRFAVFWVPYLSTRVWCM